MIQAYPKIFALGTDYIKDIFDGEVEVTEKVDGSQFAFTREGDEVETRSKGAIIYIHSCPNMFNKAVQYVNEIKDSIPTELAFYGECINTPKHNTLTYGRVPKHNIMLFGIMWKEKQAMLDYAALEHWGRVLDLEIVPRIYQGEVGGMEKLAELLTIESVLGNVKIEGVVVKNYHKPFLLGGQPIPIMAGKLVREEFKEMNRGAWNATSDSNRWKNFLDSFKTEARWLKSIQHLQEEGKLVNEPKDIGLLIKAINNDILSEETENIKRWLFNEYKNEILRASTKGFPEYYKLRIASGSFKHDGETEPQG